MEDEGYSLPHFPSPPAGDTDLLGLLRSSYQHYLSDPCRRAGCLNSDLLRMDPWELPGTAQGRRRQKYFVSDSTDLRICCDPPATSGGTWESRSLGWGIRVPDKGDDPTRFAGLKRTYYWVDTEPSVHGCAKTRWVMNVYFLLDHKGKVKSDLVLCHIFEHGSADYDPRPQCASHEAPAAAGKAPGSSLTTHQPVHLLNQSCDQDPGDPLKEAMAIHGQSNDSISVVVPGICLTQPGSNQPLSPVTSSYLEQLEKLICPETSTEPENYNPNVGGPPSTLAAKGKNRRPGKRTKTCSDVWQRFTKLCAADGPGGDLETVLAVCNHCCKVLKADSRNGTSHLIRHKCPCNH